MPTATIQMKNSAIDRTSEIFSADQVSMCRSCSRARRGPPPDDLGPRAPTGHSGAVGGEEVDDDGVTTGAAPVAGGTGGAPGGPPTRPAAAGAPVAGVW